MAPPQTDNDLWTKRLDEAARELHATAKPSVQLRARNYTALPAARSRSAHPVFMWGGVSLAAATTVAAGVTITMLLTPVTPVYPVAAFAEVENAMRSVRTAHWKQTELFLDENGKELYRTVTENWASLAPAALYRTVVQASSTPRVLYSRRVGQQTLERPEAWFFYDPAIHKGSRNLMWPYRIGPEGMERARALREEILRRLVLQSTTAPSPRQAFLGQPSRALADQTVRWQTSHTRLDGRQTDLFQQRIDSSKSSSPIRFQEMKIWADPRTRRIVRREMRDSLHFYRRTIVVIDEDFSYDQTPPSGTFDFTPPPGAVIAVQGESVWTKLSPADQITLQEAIVHTDDGWQRGDFDHFAFGWDFDNPKSNAYDIGSGLEQRRRWQNLVPAQKGKWAEWRSQIANVSTLNNASVKATFFIVRTRAEGKWADNGQTWQAEPTYLFLRDKTGKLRLVDWRIKDLLVQLDKDHHPSIAHSAR